jgi:hypothetical protein
MSRQSAAKRSMSQLAMIEEDMDDDGFITTKR